MGFTIAFEPAVFRIGLPVPGIGLHRILNDGFNVLSCGIACNECEQREGKNALHHRLHTTACSFTNCVLLRFSRPQDRGIAAPSRLLQAG